MSKKCKYLTLVHSQINTLYSPLVSSKRLLKTSHLYTSLFLQLAFHILSNGLKVTLIFIGWHIIIRKPLSWLPVINSPTLLTPLGAAEIPGLGDAKFHWNDLVKIQAKCNVHDRHKEQHKDAALDRISVKRGTCVWKGQALCAVLEQKD